MKATVIMLHAALFCTLRDTPAQEMLLLCIPLQLVDAIYIYIYIYSTTPVGFSPHGLITVQ